MIVHGPWGAPRLVCDECGCHWFDRTTDRCYECGAPVSAESKREYAEALKSFQSERDSPPHPEDNPRSRN